MINISQPYIDENEIKAVENVLKSAENDDLHSASLSSFILNFGDVLTTEEIINSN